MVLGDQDLDAFVADGVLVTLGSNTTMGQLDDVEELVLAGEHALGSIGGRVGVLIETGSLAGLAVGSQITAGALSLEVVARAQIHDGRYTQLICRQL